MENISIDFIKQTVEKVSNIEDLSLYVRKRKYPLTRYLAFKLCKEYVPKRIATQEEISSKFGLKNRTNVVHGLKQFENFKDQSFYKPYLDVYKLSKLVIEEKINGIENHLNIVKSFNDNNNDEHSKKSINNILDFIYKFYKDY